MQQLNLTAQLFSLIFSHFSKKLKTQVAAGTDNSKILGILTNYSLGTWRRHIQQLSMHIIMLHDKDDSSYELQIVATVQSE